MKKLTPKQRLAQLKGIAALSDGLIDTSDIPELTDRQLAEGVRGLMYRPIKKPVTIRLDADVIAWLKRDGPGYQTKANALLRREMLRSCRERKAPKSANNAASAQKRQKRSR